MLRNNGLILYTRLPDYFYQCLREFCIKYDYRCKVYTYSGDSNTSFSFISDEYITLFDKSEFNITQLLKENFDFIYCSSWRDKEYRKICQENKNKIPVIIGLDNPWIGNYKQWINVFISSFTVKPYFNKVWVAGNPQNIYARKLGYKSKDIFQGLYSADTKKFLISESFENIPRQKTILFIGRFVSYKNPLMLAEAFSELVDEMIQAKEWTLTFTGRGPQLEELLKYSNKNIIIQDFVNPENLPKLFQSASVFCLPAEHEHWGVVVHEAAYSGLPLLLSNTVASGSAFLEDNANGFLFKSGSKHSLKKKLAQIITMSSGELNKMGIVSRRKGLAITVDSWSETLFKIVRDFSINER